MLFEDVRSISESKFVVTQNFQTSMRDKEMMNYDTITCKESLQLQLIIGQDKKVIKQLYL